MSETKTTKERESYKGLNSKNVFVTEYVSVCVCEREIVTGSN